MSDLRLLISDFWSLTSGIITEGSEQQIFDFRPLTSVSPRAKKANRKGLCAGREEWLAAPSAYLARSPLRFASCPLITAKR
jgi:hypothetical protein